MGHPRPVEIVGSPLFKSMANDPGYKAFPRKMDLPKREALLKWQRALEDVADGLDPFAVDAEAIGDLERRILSRPRGPRLVAIEGGRP